MKFISTALALAAVAVAAPVEERSLQKRFSGNYVQNYNGGVANFNYNEGAGTYTANWNGNTDFVVGLGWSEGSAR